MAQETDTKIEARVYPIAEPKKETLAFASIAIDDKFVVSGIRVVSGQNGPFMSMPQTTDTNGKYRDLCFPLTNELRQQIIDTVLAEYSVALDALVTKKESTVEKLRAAATAVKARPAAAAVKEKSAKHAGAEL